MSQINKKNKQYVLFEKNENNGQTFYLKLLTNVFDTKEGEFRNLLFNKATGETIPTAWNNIKI